MILFVIFTVFTAEILPFEETAIHWQQQLSSGISLYFFFFYSPDVEALQVQVNKEAVRAEEWNTHLVDMQAKIEEEEKEHNDMLILPLVDTYSHLPQKVMAFLDW